MWAVQVKNLSLTRGALEGGGRGEGGVAVMLTQLLRISYDVIRRSLGFKWKICPSCFCGEKTFACHQVGQVQEASKGKEGD